MLLKSVATTFLRRSKHKKLCSLSYSTSTESTTPQERLQSFRTNENDPTKHSLDSLAQFYTLPDQDKSHLFEYGGIPKKFDVQSKTFNESCLMIRKPALDVINCLKSVDYTKPPVRFVLYGKMGSGKSLSLAHILHFGLKNNYLLVHVPWASNFLRRPKEKSNSETREGCYDLNLDVAAWLVQFKAQNAHLLSDPNMKTSVDHVWSKREVTPKDSPIKDLLEHGINRVKYASESLLALIDEIKILSSQGVCRTLVVIDGFNAFFYPKTNVYREGKIPIPPNKITLTEAFLNVTKYDWKNAAIVLTVDTLATGALEEESSLPKFLLGKEGFEHLDPFIPIKVDEYSDKELRSVMNYFRERKWITHYEGIDDEVSFLSGNNPYRLMDICKGL